MCNAPLPILRTYIPTCISLARQYGQQCNVPRPILCTHTHRTLPHFAIHGRGTQVRYAVGVKGPGARVAAHKRTSVPADFAEVDVLFRHLGLACENASPLDDSITTIALSQNQRNSIKRNIEKEYIQCSRE